MTIMTIDFKMRAVNEVNYVQRSPRRYKKVFSKRERDKEPLNIDLKK